MVQAFFRRGAALVLSLQVCLLAEPLRAVTSNPIGLVQTDGVVRLGEEIVRAASVVYSGDRLSTQEGRATISLARSDLLVFDRNSGAAFRKSSEGTFIGLEKGKLSLASSGQLPIQVETDGLTLSPAGTLPSLSEIALSGDGSILVAVHRGTISVGNLGTVPVVLTAGQMLTVNPRLAQSQQTVGTGARGKMTLGEKLRTFRIGRLSHAASLGVAVVAIGGAAAAAIILPMALKGSRLSPSTP